MKRMLGYIILGLVLPTLLMTGCDRSNDDGVKMTATVTAIDDRIEVEVLESEYTAGPHWVITTEETVFEKNGRKITRDGISVGDTVEIYYNGQVMLSFPPQIVAHRIVVK